MRKLLVLLLSIASPAFALSNRCFVKSTGMDVGTCTLGAPCRSFSFAMTQVAATGEVIALDTAGYGTFTIGQSVSVFAPNGVTAFIAVTSGTGITINAGLSDAVILRGLALSSNGGSVGIDFTSGFSLSIENCIINGFSNEGVNMARASDTSSPHMRIENSTIRNNSFGVFTSNTGTAPPQGGQPPGIAGLTISNCSLSENSEGLYAADNTRAAVSDTVFSGNAAGLIVASQADLSYADVNLERCTISQNNQRGIQAGLGAGTNRGIVRIAHNLITGNNVSIAELVGGSVASMNTGSGSTNTIEGNVSNVSPSGSYTAK